MKIRHFFMSHLSAAALLTLTSLQAGAMTMQEAQSSANAAYAAMSDGKFSAAADGYSTAIASGVLSGEAKANALLGRAFARQKLDDLHGAREDYTAVIAADGISTELRGLARYNRGLVFHRLHDLPHAIEDFTASIMARSKAPEAYLSRGRALRESGQLLFAVSDFERALKLNHPDKARIQFLVALTHEQLQRPFEARKYYMEALVADPAMTTARERLAALGGPVAPAVATTLPATSAIVTASVDVVKNALPQPVVPSEELMAGAQAARQQAAEPRSADAPRAKKLYTDRILPSELAAGDAAQPVGVEEVVASPETTGSTGPAPAVAVSTPATGWAVQIVSADSEQGARSSWQRMQKKFKILRGFDPQIVRADLGTKGIKYRVRLLGYGKQSEAAKVCSSLKSKGVSCYISNTGS